MKKIILGCCLFLFLCGCEKTTDTKNLQPDKNTLTLTELSTEAYLPVKVSFLPLNEIVASQGSDKTGKIVVYVNLMDAAESAIKYPGVFRFELYEYVPDIAEFKGKRLAIWVDQDLTEFNENNAAWRDFLRAYQFELAFDLSPKNKYVLVVTYTSSLGKRLSSQTIITAK